MSIAEIIPAVRALPRSEKVQLARFLLDDLGVCPSFDSRLFYH